LSKKLSDGQIRKKKQLSDEVLTQIWKLYKFENESLRSIEEITGVPKSTVFDFISGKTYKEFERVDNITELNESKRLIGESDPQELFDCLVNSINKYKFGGYKEYSCIEPDPKETKVTWKPLEQKYQCTFGERVWSPVKKEARNILVIGDLHEPWCLDEYPSFCKAIYKKYDCNHVIFIGDIIDNHYSSFYKSDPDGMSAKDELYYVKKKIKNWYSIFQKADVCWGNHDRLLLRRAFDSGVSKEWVRSINEVLEIPNWNFQYNFVYDDVLYTHGTGMKAHTKAGKEMMSVVAGHWHHDCYITYLTGRNKTIFSMQVPVGINHKAYAFDYAKDMPKPTLGCGVVLNDGKLPIIELMREI